MSNYQTPRSYSYSYRGRGRNKGHHSRLWLVLILCLALVAVILFGIARYLQRYMVYTREGAYLSFTGAVLPEPVPVDTEPLPELDVVVETAVPPVSRSDPARLRAVEISISQLLHGDAPSLLKENRGNALVIEMKGTDGVLRWQSRQTELTGSYGDALPEDGGTSDPDPDAGSANGSIFIPVSDQAADIAAAVQACKEEGIYLIAGLSLFRDGNLSASPAFVLTAPEDPDALPQEDWINPSNVILQVFYSNLAQELYALGFDELLFSNAQYPGGDTVGQEARSAALSQFWSGFDQKLSETGAAGLRIGVLTDPSVLTRDENTASGQVFSNLISSVDRLWCDMPEASFDQLTLDPEFLAAGGFVLVQDAFQEECVTPAQAILTK